MIRENTMFESFLSQEGQVNIQGLKEAFIVQLKDQPHAYKIFEDVFEEFEGTEGVEVCSEIVKTLNAECTADDFHNWDYDHLEYIIDLSNKYQLTIPRNLINGLPEQLILLINKNNLTEPGCP